MSHDNRPSRPLELAPQIANPCQACAIRVHSVCGALEPAELNRLAAITTQTEAEPRETIFIEGDPADYLFVVTGGGVRMYKLLPDGRRQITGFIFTGDFLGLALYDNYAYSAEAMTKLQLCRFPRRKLEKLLDEFPKLERRLLKTASNELAAAQDQMLLLGRKTAREKIATFLLSLSERAIRRGERGDVIALPMSREDIGDYLGLAIETVSRTFTRFKKLGVVYHSNPREAKILDREALQHIAGMAEDMSLTATAAFRRR